MQVQDPFHEGEHGMQARAGETGAALLNARMIAPTIPRGAWPFLTRQPMVILGGEGAEGMLWCSALLGAPGFAAAEDEGAALSLDLREARVHPEDPLLVSLAAGQRLGALFIEPSTRRRLRVNGRLAEAGPERLRLEVEEAFPNCPKHIRPRTFDGHGEEHAGALRGSELPEQLQDLIRAADTLFLATVHAGRGADVSHRGGDPGFAQVLGPRTLLLPDYAGNSLFQSFGNLALDARMGLLIPDYRTGGQTHLTGTARVLWDAPDPKGQMGGTNRQLEVTVEQWRFIPGGLRGS